MPLDNAQPFCRVRLLKTWEESIREHKLMLEEQAAIKKEKSLENIDGGSNLEVSNVKETFQSDPNPSYLALEGLNDAENNMGNTLSTSNGKPIFSDEEKAKIVAYANTTSQAEAARKFNIHRSMVSRWMIKSKAGAL